MKESGGEYYGPIPSKSLWSYFLLIFSSFFYIPFLRKLVSIFALPYCRKISFEPGFRFFYGNNIHAKKVFFGNTLIMDYAKVNIGEDTVFSRDNKVITATHDFFDRNKIIAKPVTIGKNVWITTNCIILPGVSIGDNSIIGAGSVVSKDIPSNCFAAGNPCVVKKKYNPVNLTPFAF